MKRESGANPEQTRCCKFLSKSLNTLQATVRHRMGRHSKTEQVRRPAKTNIVLKLSGNKATKHRVKSFFIPLHKDIISPCVYSLKQVMNTISRIKMKVFVHVFLLLVCLLQLSLTAQNKITLSGKVTDQQGTPLSLERSPSKTRSPALIRMTVGFIPYKYPLANTHSSYPP